MKTYVFPGQGSQAKGMGKDLFDEYPELVMKADAILGYSIKDLCLNDSKNQLGQTQYTQPALYVVNALSFLKNMNTEKSKISYFAGHSLGEYNALFAAGAFDFETGLKLIQKRGDLMSNVSGGGMAAVIGLSDEQIKDVIDKNQLETISIANYNSPGQVVLAGPQNDIANVQPFFEKAGAKLFIPLKVSGAFHSQYMQDAANDFSIFIKQFEFNELHTPVVSNVTARPYKQSEIRDNLINQITNSVQWTESIRYIIGKKCDKFEEIGPGKVLQGLIKKIKKTTLVSN